MRKWRPGESKYLFTDTQLGSGRAGIQTQVCSTWSPLKVLLGVIWWALAQEHLEPSLGAAAHTTSLWQKYDDEIGYNKKAMPVSHPQARPAPRHPALFCIRFLLSSSGQRWVGHTPPHLSCPSLLLGPAWWEREASLTCAFPQVRAVRPWHLQPGAHQLPSSLRQMHLGSCLHTDRTPRLKWATRAIPTPFTTATQTPVTSWAPWTSLGELVALTISTLCATVLGKGLDT